MKMHKISALLYRSRRIVLKSKYRLIDFFFFPITTIIIWGFFAVFARGTAAEAGMIVLVVNIFWSFSLVSQSAANMLVNEDVWTGSLKQILATGISEWEYLISRLVSSTIIAVAVMSVMLWLSTLFGFVISGAVFAWILLFSILALAASVGIAIMVDALFIHLGEEYSFLAWTALQGFILLSAPFYPVEILPPVMQVIAQFMPFTAIFSGVRSIATVGSAGFNVILNSAIMAVVYIAISMPLYYLSFRTARKTGRLARME